MVKADDLSDILVTEILELPALARELDCQPGDILAYQPPPGGLT